MKDAVQEWYATFINSVEQEMLFELVLAANFMAIEPLLHLSCATIASQVKGKTPEQIKEHFHIEREMVPVDEARIREENKWAEED